MSRKKESPIVAKMKKAKGKLNFKSEAEIEVRERQLAELTGQRLIKESCEQVKGHIGKQPQPQEQLLFSFMPTTMTRTSPFLILSKRDQKNRSFSEQIYETSWGRITITGKQLAVHPDETVLCSLLALVAKYRCETFETTPHELCKIAGVTPAKKTYKVIWDSIRRLTGTRIELEIWEGKGKNRKTQIAMVNTILTGGLKNGYTGKIRITVNPYFLQMYGESFITNIDLKFRNSLKGDTAKALYRFFAGQRENKYSCHMLTLATAINLNTEQPLTEVRRLIRKGLRELRSKGFLDRWMFPNRTEIVTVWKSKKRLSK